MLDSEDVAVEACSPLLPLHGHLKITQSIAYVAFDLTPKKLRIIVDHVGRVGIAELLVNASLDQLVIKGVQLAGIKRVAQLADQIAGSDQACFGVRRRVVVIIRNWKARELNGIGACGPRRCKPRVKNALGP